MKTDKPAFGAIPPRAFGDTRLTAEMFRVLGAIALHDRLGANGMGCYASGKRLAVIANCHEKSVFRAITALIQFGYVEEDRRTAKLRVLRVIYSEFDRQYVQAASGANGSRIATQEGSIGSSVATIVARVGSKHATQTPPVGSTVSEEAEQIQEVAEDNIFRETGINLVETNERNPVETASSKKPEGKSVGAMLGMAERSIKANRNLKAWHDWLERLVEDTTDSQDPYQAWAERLLVEAGDKMDAAA